MYEIELKCYWISLPSSLFFSSKQCSWCVQCLEFILLLWQKALKFKYILPCVCIIIYLLIFTNDTMLSADWALLHLINCDFQFKYYIHIYMSWVYSISALILIYSAFIHYIEFTAHISVDKIFYIIIWDHAIWAA